MSKPPQQLVRINTDRTTPLSKAQKTFNRLTKRIAEQEAQLAELRAALDAGRIRIQADLLPLHNQFDKLRADMVRLFDRLYTHNTFTKVERRKLTTLIIDISYELIQKGFDDLTEIHDRYDEGGFEAAVAEADEQSAATLRHMAEAMLGIEFDAEADLSDSHKVRQYINDQLRQRAERERQQKAEQETSRVKSEKQQAREAKKQAEAIHSTKAVRALYLDLVKAFHPDREPDEAEKERKTAIMQRVTEAYEKNDLMGLFRLQLAFERMDGAHLERLADAQLLYYNRILQEQVGELDRQLTQTQQELGSLTSNTDYGLSTTGHSATSLEFAINSDINQMKRTVKALKADLKTLADPAYLRAWLKTYRASR